MIYLKRQAALWLSALLFLLVTQTVNAQSFIPERDSSEVSLLDYALQRPLQTPAFRLNLQMNAAFHSQFEESRYLNSSFRFNQIKLEAFGEIRETFFYWYRQRLNDWDAPLAPENLPESLEYAMIGYRFHPKWAIMAGKQHAAWGGFEYDLNPIDVYQYSDANDYMDCYFTGLTLAYQPRPTQEFMVQVTNNRLGSLKDMYGILPPSVRRTKAAFNYNLNWNSSYMDDLLTLRYSITAGQQAKNKWMFMAWGGQQLETDNTCTYLDVMYTRGALDPMGILTDFTLREDADDALPYGMQHTAYFSLVARTDWRFHAKWGLFAKGMYETASLYRSSSLPGVKGPLTKGKYRTALGYTAWVAFYPFADDNFRLFCQGTGRVYQLTHRADPFEFSMPNGGRISVGFSYNLPVF